MHIQFISNIAKENPALARLIEASLISWLAYLAWAVVEWKMFSTQWLIQAVMVPAYLAITKLNRDIWKKSKR
jgi:uncharacterized membrane protein